MRAAARAYLYITFLGLVVFDTPQKLLDHQLVPLSAQEHPILGRVELLSAATSACHDPHQP